MILEGVDVPTWQIIFVADRLAEHFTQVLIRLLCLVCNQFLGELVHEVGSHSNHLCIIEILFHTPEVLLLIIFEVAISHIVVLVLQLYVEGGQVRIRLS